MNNMQKIIIMASILITGVLFSSRVVNAQGMMGRFNNPSVTPTSSETSTAQDEAAGKVIYDKLQSKQTTCQNLVDDDFDVLGDYYMGQQLGSTAIHASMNNMMTNMMGEEGEKQMHITLGKRVSSCNTNASFPPGYGLPTMWWMMGGGENPMMGYGGWNNMMGWNGFSLLGWIPMLLFWVVLILGVVALLRYVGQSKKHDSGKTPLEFLKERYARGEIDKKEFEQIKKDIS